MDTELRSRLEQAALSKLGEDVKEALSQVRQIEDEIEAVDRKFEKDVLALEAKYVHIRSPIYKKRDTYTRKVQGFWKKCFENHPVACQMFTDEDWKVLDYLTNVEVSPYGSADDIQPGYEIIFSFQDNPYFTNRRLTKSFRWPKEGEPAYKIETTAISWKPNMCLTSKHTEDEDSSAGAKRARSSALTALSFFEWFNQSELDLDFGDIIRDEIWSNPLKYYLELPDSDSETEDGSGGAAL